MLGRVRYLVSIHDVWQGNRALVDGYLRRLAALGAERVALLVVPRYHDRGDFDADREFPDWLRAQADAGRELFLHGFTHSASAADGRRSAWGKWINRRWGGGEAELCGLPAEDQVRLLDAACAAFARQGLRADGFVAPTWFGTPPPGQLRARGFRFRESRFFVTDVTTGKSRFIPPLAWAPGAWSRRLDRHVLARPWGRALGTMSWLRIALHPGDLERGGVEDSLRNLLPLGTCRRYRDAFP